jgi:hypothetical protein
VAVGLQDPKLDPGAQHEQDVIDNSQHGGGQSDYSAPDDASGAKDYSNPRGAETAAGLSGLENSAKAPDKLDDVNDILSGEQNQPDFKYGRNKNIKSRGRSSSGRGLMGFIKSHKKSSAIIGGGSILIVALGLMCGVLSGPAHWLQLASLIKNTKLFVTTAQTADRYVHDLSSLKTWSSKGVGGVVQKSRIGLMGNHVATKALKSLSNNGIDMDTDVLGTGRSITIDPEKTLGTNYNDLSESGQETFKDMESDALGIDRKYLSITSDGKLSILLDGLSYGESRQLINKLNDVGKFNVIGQIRTRLILKKVGKISWLHPIRKVEAAAVKKFATWLQERADKIALKYGAMTAEQAAKNAGERAAANEAAKKGSTEASIAAARTTAEDGAKKAAQEVIDKATDEAGKKTALAIVKGGFAKAASALASNAIDGVPIVGWIKAIITAYCLIEGMQNSVGANKYAQVVIPAMGETAEFLGTASQLQSGDDITMSQLQNSSRYYLYNDNVQNQIATTDGKGNQLGTKTVGTISSSIDDSAPILAMNGDQYSSESRADVPLALDDVSNPNLSFGGNSTAGEIYSGIAKGLKLSFDSATGGLAVEAISKLTGISLPTPMDAVCWVMDKFNSIIGNVVGWIMDKSGLSAQLQNWGPMTSIANMMQEAQGWIMGDPLNTTTATPQENGAIAAYGAQFISNQQMVQLGGRALTKTEQSALEQNQKTFLARQEAEKPLLAKIFDPDDYNSSIAQIGRVAGLDTTNRSFGTILKNIGKIVTSAPTFLGSAISKITGGASADSSVSYDYGVPDYAFSDDEMDTINSGNNYDMYTNAQNVFNGLNDGSISRGVVEKCFGASIGDAPDYTVSFADDSDGKAWNYVDNGNDPDCTKSNLLPVRTYLLDYGIMSASDCYNSDSSDDDGTCAENGLDTTTQPGSDNGDSSNSASSSTDLAWPIRSPSFSSNSSFFLGSHTLATGTAWGSTPGMTGKDNGAGIADDLAVASGTKVYAIYSGKVTSTNLCGAGDGVAIESTVDGKTLDISYMHGINQQVEVGDTVQAGDYIEDSNMKGCSATGSHLHIGMTFDGKYICPQDVFASMGSNQTIDWSSLPAKANAGCGGRSAK